MEREIEVKLLGLDNELIEERLKSLGAELIADEEQENIRINSSHHPIDSKKGGYLRIRKTKDLINKKEIIYLTFKKHISDKSARENIEYTSVIDNPDDLINIFKSLDYDIYDTGYKKRKSYLYKKMRFDFDSWDKNTYPDPFIEVEFENKEEFYKILDELKVDKSAISTLSIAELKKMYKNSMTYWLNML